MSNWIRREVYHPDSAQWRFVALSIGVTILFVAYILYWNRLLASLACFCLRLATWDRHSPGSFWIEAESIHISLISGRIMLRDVRYCSANQTIRAVKCFITWRYWLWRTRDKNDTEPNGPEDALRGKSNANVPCRILLQFEGLEWLLYNRTMVYDEILKQAQKAAGAEATAKDQKKRPHEAQDLLDELEVERSGWSPETHLSTMQPEGPVEANAHRESIEEQRYPPTGFRVAIPKMDLPSKVWSWVMSKLPTFDFNDLLPIALEAKRGAITLGNASTPVIFTVTFGTGHGTYGLKPSRSRYDEYKQVYQLEFQHVALTAEDHNDHRISMADYGRRLHERFNQIRPKSRLGYAFSTFRVSMTGVPTDGLDRTEKPTPPPAKWTGLGTFMTEAERQQQKREEAEEAKRLAEKRRYEVGPEYAQDGNLLATPKLEVTYYVDVAGRVPEDPLSMEGTDELVDIGNGDVAPQWGVDLVMHGGTIVYGPWADRRRKLEEGDLRLWTEFRLFVEFAEDVNLRIPCREASKDWQFDQLPDLGHHRRQAAVLSCKIAQRSTIHYVMPLVASETGYQTSLKAQLFRVAVDSSLNSKVFLEASECRIQCNLPAPLRWNQARQWDFLVRLEDPELYLLRDHVTLLTDLGKDWSAGPPNDLIYFIPMIYSVKFALKNYSLSFNANDQNIVDSLNNPDANTLITLRGSNLNSVVTIPSAKYRPEVTTVPFSIESADNLTLSLTFPKWNTRAAHATPQNTDLGRAESLRIDGSYRYHSFVKREFVDRLTLNLHGRTVTFKAFGWAIRHFMVLQANYFGSFTNFTLPSEAIARRQRKDPLGDPVEAKYRAGQSNLLEVCLELDVSDATMALPEALLGYETYEGPDAKGPMGIGSCLLISIPELSVSFRLHDCSLEATLNVHPVGISSEATCSDDALWNAAKSRRRRKEILTISELDIIAHRLFGPRPQTATYVCMWEIVLGDVKGVMAPSEIHKIISALSSFKLNFKDELNAPAQEFMLETYPDVTFLKLRLNSLRVNVETGDTSLAIVLPGGFQLSLNDMPTDSRAGLISVIIPEGQVQALLQASKDGQIWLEAAAATFDAAIDVYSRPADWKTEGKKQLDFVRVQDSLTRRVPFIYEPGHTYGARSSRYASLLLPHPSLVKPTQGAKSSTRIVQREATSESEESDEHINPDERLVLSKPSSTRNLQVTTQDSSVTDESDEPYSGTESVPATAEYDSDDDWTDDYGWPELCHHANVVRQFKDLRLETLAGISDQRFELAREARTPPGRHDEDEGIRSINCTLEETVPGGDDTPALRIVSKRGLDVVVNPILVHVVWSILPALYNNVPSIELELDHLMAKLLKKKPSKASQRPMFFEIAIPSIRLRSIQSILSSYEADLLREPFGDPSPSNLLPVHSRIVTVLDASLSLPTASGIPGSEDQPLVLNVHEGKLTLVTYDSHLLAAMHRTHKAVTNSVLELSIANSGATFGKTTQSKLGNVKATFHAEAPAPVLATVALAGKVASQIFEAINKWAGVGAARSKFIVRTALEATDKAQSDPLSTVVTPYLVQSGRPRDLRADISWKILNHARQQLPHLEAKERDHIIDIARRRDWESDITADELVATFQKSWADWIVDFTEAKIETLPLFDLLSPINPPIIVQSVIQPISIETGFFHFILDDPTELGSDIRIGPFNINVLERRPTLTVLQTVGSTASLVRVASTAPSQQSFRHVGVVCDLGTFHINLSPALLPFAGRVVRAQRHLSPPPKSPTSPAMGKMQGFIPPPRSQNNFVVDMTFHFEDLRIISSAYNFSFTLSLLHPTLALHSRLGPLSAKPFLQLAADTAGTITCSWESFNLRVTESVEHGARTTLAEFGVQALHTNVAWYSRTRERPVVRVSLAVGQMRFAVPRHVARLLQSVETWWDGYFLNQVNPFLNLITVASSPRPSRKVVFKPQEALTIDIQANIAKLVVRLHAVLGVWLVWEVKNLGMAGHGHKPVNSQTARGAVVLRLHSHSLALETWRDPDDAESFLQEHSFSFPFPPLQISARLVKNVVQCQGTLDLFELRLNANAIDAFVRASRQLASSDLDRILTLFKRTRDKAPQPIPASPRRPSFDAVTLQARFQLSGLRIVLEGASSLCFFDVKDVSCEASGTKVWSLKVLDVSFSLAPSVAPSADFDRRYRLAYMVFDLETTSSQDLETGAHLLDFRVDKVHAVLQAAALGVLGDLVDSYQGEVLRGREEVIRQRSMRRQRNQSFSKQPEQSAKLTSSTSWLEKRVINVTIRNFGAAIPLTLHQTESFLPSETTESPAFLFSILLMSFKTHFGEVSNATVERFALQFLENFDQSKPSHFISHNHTSQNQMVYPDMRAEIHSRLTPNTVEWVLKGHVSGFELDVDPGIATFVFSLLDVYRLGLSQLELLSEAVQQTDLASPILPTYEKFPQKRSTLNTRTTHIISFLEFQSGHVRLHHEEQQTALRPRAQSIPVISTTTGSQRTELSADILLPMVSLWIEWRATPASLKGGSMSDETPSSLAFKSTIHSSKNTIQPTILKFVSQLLAKVESRLNKPSIVGIPATKSSTEATEANGESTSTLQTMSITFSLRIDQSTLEFTCLPDVNVQGALHWESGGFVATAIPGVKSFAFIGSVENLRAHLRHGYLMEDSAEATIRNLAFSAALSISRDERGMGSSRTSIVVETDLKTAVIVSRLQDVLCFKAVWFDSFSSMGSQIVTPTSPLTTVSRETASSSIRRASRRQWSTVLLVKIRKLEARADLGSSISVGQLTLEPVTFRTLFSDKLSELFFSVDMSDLVAEGLFSGKVTVPNFLFRTVRGREQNYDFHDGKETLLKIELQSGRLQMAMSFEGKAVFLYDSQPLQIVTLDDWSHCREASEDHKLLLHFLLVATGVNVVAVTSAPAIFVDMAQRIQGLLSAQYDGAAKESEAYRRTTTPKRQLTDVANSVVRSSHQEKSNSFKWTTVQDMEVKLDHLFIGLARESLADAQPWGGLQATEFKAQLTRYVGGSEDERRSDMVLALGSLQLHRFVPLTSKDAPTATQWLQRGYSEKKEVLTVPPMRIDMKTREFIDRGISILAYDLQNELGIRDDHRQFSIGTDLILFDWVRDMYRLTVQRVTEMLARSDASGPKEGDTGAEESGEELPQALSLEPTARATGAPSRSGPFERGGKLWRPESIRMVPPVIQQLGNFSPGVGFYNLVVQGSLDQAVAIWVHELVTIPVSELNNVLLSLYTKQLQTDTHG